MKKRLVIHGIDIWGESLQEWSPPNATDFEFEVTIDIGLEGADGTMLFRLLVTSIKRIQSFQSNEFLSKRLLVKSYDASYIEHFIKSVINTNIFEDWNDTKEYLDYHFSNEYFNYNNKYFIIKH
ncbi:MAG TPA: Imm8 family immunity protein [Rhabdaerophilum sp.]|nr:Imm8 family immunity protein [Rhabdaerophilum sp.]